VRIAGNHDAGDEQATGSNIHRTGVQKARGSCTHVPRQLSGLAAAHAVLTALLWVRPSASALAGMSARIRAKVR